MKHAPKKAAFVVGLIIASLTLGGCYDDGRPGGWGHHHPRNGERDYRN